MFLTYVHGAKVHIFFACATQNHPIILRNSLIFILRYIMAQKSDEVRSCIQNLLENFFIFVMKKVLKKVDFFVKMIYLCIAFPPTLMWVEHLTLY